MVRRRSWFRGWGRKGGVVSPRTRARGSLHLVPLTQILVPLHHLLCSPALSPPSMTHRSLSQCRPHSLTLTLNHVFYLGSRFHHACAVEGRCVGVVRGQAGHRLAATLFNRCWSSAVPWAPKSQAVPENLRFHSRNVCQRPHTSALILLQSARAYCTPSKERKRVRTKLDSSRCGTDYLC